MHFTALVIGIVLTSGAQVLLKSGVSYEDSWVRSFLAWRTLVSYGLFGLVTILHVYALQEIDLKTYGAWISVNYILVTLLSWAILREKTPRNTVVGCGLIVMGILIFNLPK